MEVLRKRWGMREGECSWVFPSYGKAGHLVEPKMVWAGILAEAKIKDLRIHDLRRTLGSWMTGTGANLQMIGKQLGHGNDSRATAIYARLNIEPVAAAVNVAAEAMVKASQAAQAQDAKKSA
jgi:integrase